MTEKLYYSDGHLANFTAKVLSCTEENGRYAVVLDRTAFFPGVGGQDADEGELGGMRLLGLREDGEEIIAPAYDQARSFSGGVAAVCRDGLWGFIDEAGEVVVDFQFADAGSFSPDDGSCPVQQEENGPYEIIQWAVAR